MKFEKFHIFGIYSTVCRSDGDVYVAFGLSGSTNQTRMLGADVTVAWIDRAGRANAQDYSLSSYIQV